MTEDFDCRNAVKKGEANGIAPQNLEGVERNPLQSKSLIPEVSVIIPIYKAEAYLPACLESLFAQTFQNWEAICVNDGSPDKCGKILAKYAQKDKRIKVITQTNQGITTTRNNALKKACGEYICFLDSDDMLHPEFLKILLENIKRYPVQVIGSDFSTFSDTFSFASVPSKINVKYYKSPLSKYLFRQMKYNAMIWGKLYHKSIFQDLCFDSELHYGEDTHISIQILSKIHCIAFIPVCLYAYRTSSNSLTRSAFNTTMIDDHILSGVKLNAYFEEGKFSKLVRYLIKRKGANRSFRWACIKPYKKDKENYRSIWEKYIPIFDDLIHQKKFTPLNLSIKYWLPFYLWHHKHWKALKLFGIGRK